MLKDRESRVRRNSQDHGRLESTHGEFGGVKRMAVFRGGCKRSLTLDVCT